MKDSFVPRVLAFAAVASILISACATPNASAPAPAQPTTAAATEAPAQATLAPTAESATETAPTEAAATAPVTTTEATQAPAPAASGNVVFLSTQAVPVEEAEAMRSQILASFQGGTVEFVPEAAGPFSDRLGAEASAGSGTVDVAGGLVGDLSPHAAKFKDLSELKTKLGDRGIPEPYWFVSNLGSDKVLMVPWMQATLLMAVNKKALQYLPQGADVNTLTYDQLLAWGKAIKDATGEAKIGFAAGDQGLIHRFFQGYLVPAFTGGVVTTFANADAEAAWKYFTDLWPYVNPQSTTYNFMQEQLLSEEVWITVDHVARLKDAFAQKPDEFVAAPAPAGPKGRAYMVILAGLAVPSTAPDTASAEALIDYMTLPETQAKTLNSIGFYPLGSAELPASATPGQKAMAGAVSTQASASDAQLVLIPQGLGAKGGDFNKVFRDTFTRVVLNGEAIRAVLDEQKTTLQTVIDEAKAACWSPDPDSSGQPCKVQ